MNRKLVWVGAVSVVALASLATLLIFPQSNLLLRAGVVSGTVPNEVAEEVSPEPTPSDTDDAHQKETDCQAQKAGHILHCGMGLPEDDYACRTTHAEHAYQECLAQWRPADASFLPTPEPPPL